MFILVKFDKLNINRFNAIWPIEYFTAIWSFECDFDQRAVTSIGHTLRPNKSDFNEHNFVGQYIDQ